jgi:hypothetical protein
MSIDLSILGITGGKNGTPERAARAEIMRAYHEDGSICIVLTRENLEELIRQDSGFFWMLLEKNMRSIGLVDPELSAE